MFDRKSRLYIVRQGGRPYTWPHSPYKVAFTGKEAVQGKGHLSPTAYTPEKETLTGSRPHFPFSFNFFCWDYSLTHSLSFYSELICISQKLNSSTQELELNLLTHAHCLGHSLIQLTHMNTIYIYSSYSSPLTQSPPLTQNLLLPLSHCSHHVL